MIKNARKSPREDGNGLEDIRMEKMLEVIFEKAYGSLPRECRKDCPLLRCIGDLLVGIKSSNNDRISIELGLVGHKEWSCPRKHQG